MLIWAPGRVARVADGLTDKSSSRAKKILPAGALLFAWDADAEFGEKAGERWLILLPNKWNRQIHYGWRFHPTQLRKDAQRARGEQNDVSAVDSSDATNTRPRKQQKKRKQK